MEGHVETQQKDIEVGVKRGSGIKKIIVIWQNDSEGEGEERQGTIERF